MDNISFSRDVCPWCGRKREKHFNYQHCDKTARFIAKNNILDNKEKRYEWFKVETEVTMEFLSEYWEMKCGKLRSQFKKDFIPSVLQFYNSKGYVSKKQLEIAKNIISNKKSVYQSDEDWHRGNELEESIEKAHIHMIDEEVKNVKYDEAQFKEKYKLVDWLLKNNKIL